MNLLLNVFNRLICVTFFVKFSKVSPVIVTPIFCFEKSDICSNAVSVIYGVKSSKYRKFGVLFLARLLSIVAADEYRLNIILPKAL